MKTYVIVGVGGRSMMFTEALSKKYNNSSRLVAICDINDGRLAMNMRQLKPVFGEIQSYKVEAFDTMLKTHRPDCVIVSTRDCDHDESWKMDFPREKPQIVLH